MLALSVWLVFRAASGPLLDSNLMNVLPSLDRDPALQGAAERFLGQVERRVAVLVGAEDAAEAKAAAGRLQAALQATGLFEPLAVGGTDDLPAQAFAFYLPLRFGLLSEAARRQLQAGDRTGFERRVLARYFGPMSGLDSDLIEQDPLLLLPDFLEETAGGLSGGLALEDGFLVKRSDERVYVLLAGSLTDSPYGFGLQDALLPVFQQAASEAAAKEAATLWKAGVLFHAAAGRASAEREISRVGLGALLGILVIFLALFRSWRPLALSLVSIAVGCLGGFAACLAVFGEVHQLTLVFGASLVGISVDYALHYFCARLSPQTGATPEAVLRHIGPGITLGLVTSVIGFAGLLIAPFPGTRQIAVFSSVGLAFAYVCVLTVFPLLDRSRDNRLTPRPVSWAAGYLRLWHRPGRRGRLLLALVLLLLPAAYGLTRLQPQDDIRLLQAADPAVAAEEQRLRALVGQDLASQFFLVQGRDEAELLARAEALEAALEGARAEGQLAGSLNLARVLPSPSRWAESHALLAPLIEGEDSLLPRLARRVGLPEQTVAGYAEAFAAAEFPASGGLSAWLERGMAAPYRHLWLGTPEDGAIAAVGLEGLRDAEALRRLADPARGITFVDTVGDLSARFAEIRHQAGLLTLASYLVVALVLGFRYGLAGGLLVMLTPLAAALASLGIQGLIGEPLSLFTVLALLLVLGIGVDYGIFARETGAESPTTLLAIALSAVTTFLAFGLLALSSTAAVHTFGLTILLGIAVAALLSPVAARPGPDQEGRA